MQLHDILLLRTSTSLHSVSVGAKPLSTGQCAPCRRLYQLCSKTTDFLIPIITPAKLTALFNYLTFSEIVFTFKNASAFLLRGARHAIA